MAATVVDLSAVRTDATSYAATFRTLVGLPASVIHATTGDIDIGVDANLLTVASASGFVLGQMIAIAGAGSGGSDLVTWITAISGTDFTISNASSATVTGAAVTGLNTDTPTTISAKLAAATTNQINSFTDQATSLGPFMTVDSSNYLLQVTHPSGGFPFTFGAPDFNDFGTGQIDNTFIIYSSNQPVSAVYPSANHPRFGEFLENYYNTGSQNLVENYVQYTSIDRGTDYRPWLLAVDVNTHESEFEQHLKYWKLRSRTAGSGGLPDDQVIFNTALNTNTIYGPFDVDASALTARNRSLIKVQGKQGTGNFAEFVGLDALTDGQMHIYGNPFASTASFAYFIRSYWSVPRQVNSFENYHATGTTEEYKKALAGDVFDSYEVTGQQWTHGIDYSDSAAWKLCKTYFLDTDQTNQMVRVSTAGDMLVTGNVKAPSFTIDGTDAADTVFSAISSGVKVKKHDNSTDAILRLVANNETVGLELTYETLQIYTSSGNADLKLYSKGTGSYVYLGSNTETGIRFSASDVNNIYNSATNTDLGIATNGSGNVVIRPGTTATVTCSSTKVTADVPVVLKSYTVAGVPSAATIGAGGMIYVTDETGGAIPAFSDGTNWRRVSDRAVIA